MKNPYEILNISQNATKQEIVVGTRTAQMANMKTKQYTPQELMQAHKQLLDPSKRLAADFLFPAKYKTKRPAMLTADVSLQNIDFETIDETAFDSF